MQSETVECYLKIPSSVVCCYTPQFRNMQFYSCLRQWNSDILILINLISTNKVNILKGTILLPKMPSQIIHDSGRLCKANGLRSGCFSVFTVRWLAVHLTGEKGGI